MKVIVSKFGGTSLANGRRVSRALDIEASNPDRRAMVVSAPSGVTDKLMHAADHYFRTRDYPNQLVEQVESTFREIASTNNVPEDAFVGPRIDTLETSIRNLTGDRQVYMGGITPLGEIINAELIAEIGRKKRNEYSSLPC